MNFTLENYTLKKCERLKKGDFKNRKWSKYSETDHFILFVEKNDYVLKRVGVVARKKTGSAVVRNRMKRLIKEFFRLNKTYFLENNDHLVRIKKIPKDITWKDINTELEILLENKRSL